MNRRNKSRRDKAYDAANRARYEMEAARNAYRAVFGDTPSIIGLGFDRYAAVAGILQQAIAERRPVSDEELRRRLGMTMTPPEDEI